MAPDDNTHARGLMLTAVGGMALTIDIPLIRLAQGETWSILLYRSVTTFIVSVTLWMIWRAWRGNAPALIPGWPGLVVAALYALSSMTFMTAVYNTSTANLVFILAFNTMFAALLSWVFLKERPRPATLIAMAAMIGGVAIIVWDGIGTGNLLGDALALASAFFIAAAITVTRASGRDMGFTPLVSVIVPAMIALFIVRDTGVKVDAPWWIILNGAIIIPISFFCLATGPKYISGPEVAMFYLLETVLAPVWMWMIFNEVPTRNSMIGGSILILALVAHSIWQLWDGRRRRAAAIVRHPA